MMVEILKAKGLPVLLMLLMKRTPRFRRAENIKELLTANSIFSVFKFELAEPGGSADL